MKISKNFNLSEFDGIMPEPRLINMLQELRDRLNTAIIITDSARTVKQHIAIYKKLYGGEWIHKIPWGSRHLPAFNMGLRAVDFKVVKHVIDDKVIYYSGTELYEILLDICNELNVNFGCGVGKYFVHFDIYRKHNAKWSYNY